MRAFSGIVDLPALLMIIGALIVIALANGFSFRRSAAMAHAMMLEVALLYFLVSLVPLFQDPLNFMVLPYIISFGLVTFALAGLVTLCLGIAAAPTAEAIADELPKPGFRIVGTLAFVAGMGYLAAGNGALIGYVQSSAVIFVAATLALVALLARLSGKGGVANRLGQALPSIAILGMVVGISAAVLDVYEVQFMLPLLGFGVNVVFLAILIRVFMQLVGWIDAGLDSLRVVVLGLLLGTAVSLVLLSQALI